MRFCDRVRARREELGISQEELAKRMGYKSRSTINKIELGINDVSQSKIVELAKALNTTIGYLMGDDNGTETQQHPTLDEELKDIDFALFGETKDLTDAEKEDILNYVKFKKSQRKK